MLYEYEFWRCCIKPDRLKIGTCTRGSNHPYQNGTTVWRRRALSEKLLGEIDNEGASVRRNSSGNQHALALCSQSSNFSIAPSLYIPVHIRNHAPYLPPYCTISYRRAFSPTNRKIPLEFIIYMSSRHEQNCFNWHYLFLFLSKRTIKRSNRNKHIVNQVKLHIAMLYTLNKPQLFNIKNSVN